jgi:hypothetical protein
MPVIPGTKEAEPRRIVAYSQPGQKVSKTPSQQKAGCDGAPYNSSINRRIVVQISPRKKEYKTLSAKYLK